MLNLALALSAVLQQGGTGSGLSSPPDGDTVGYWQQRVHYTMTATLDERAQRVRARGTLRYVNNSPDTLHELYFHQYLNAFRPGSRWSAADAREGRVRFQYLEEPEYGYERFTAPLRVNGDVAPVDYPGSPDSTVVHVKLARPLAPRDSLVVAFEWDARPSTVPRRQARRGRHWDLAQWYPKVAVYDRGGWQPNALQPAGELYGEFGTYDVTLIIAEDQVLAATGVPIAGDPGWTRAFRGGAVRTASRAYGDIPDAGDSSPPPPGMRTVRFYARDVHHFAWSASPDYRYEGGVYARRLRGSHFTTWDTVSVHALYRPGDDSTWGGQRVVRRTIAALQWLEAIFGPYPYPQLTANHRIDGGGTEFPMFIMNGSASQGLILHEGGHVYTYGALANNEWRSAWMDEGLTSYQTAWAQLLTPMERVRAGVPDQPAAVRGYRARAARMVLPRYEVVSVEQTRRDLLGESQPMGMIAHRFRDFDTYNDMVYDRAEIMFSQLRDLLGDTVFVGFLHDYYDRWTLKHVDERAMRASAERMSGRDLGWFFDQWLRRTGVMDYALRSVRQSRDASGAWITQPTVVRRGEYAQPMNVGVRTTAGWTLVRMNVEPYARQTVSIVSTEKPLEVRLDPFHTTWDWDRRNDVRGSRERFVIDWPFVVQADRERALSMWSPMAWYSRPGEVNVGFRQRRNYLGWLDQVEVGAVTATASGLDSRNRVQYWFELENPYFRFLTRPAVGWRLGAGHLDDVVRAEIAKRRVRTGIQSSVSDAVLTYTVRQGTELLPEAWLGTLSAWSLDLDLRSRLERRRPRGGSLFTQWRALLGGCGRCKYAKLEAAVGRVYGVSERTQFGFRFYEGLVDGSIPDYRALYVSAEDPVSTFGNHWWRPRQSILKESTPQWLPLGGGALRGYHWTVASHSLVGTNLELARRVGELRGDHGVLELWMNGFSDAGFVIAALGAGPTSSTGEDPLVDAGVGLKLQGRFYDRPITVRFDFPVFVSRPELAIDRDMPGRNVAPRWVVSFNDIW